MKKIIQTITAAILLNIFTVKILPAQAPANDNCPGAIGVSNNCTSTVVASTVNATASVPAPSCGTGDADDDIWYFFTPVTASVTVSISNAVLQPSGVASIGMEIYNGPCVDFGSVFCDNDIAIGSGEQVINNLVPGSRYLIRFWTTGTAGQGSFNFCVQETNIVPVNLVNYSAACNAGNILITWTTTNEVNNDFFTVEKSKDGVQFEPLALVDAPANASNGRYYAITDAHPFENNSFYRLKQTDLDGREKYFKVLAISCTGNYSAATVYPNPVSNMLLLKPGSNFKKGKIKITAISGNVLKEQDYLINQEQYIRINFENLPKALYLLQVTDKNGERQIFKILKN